MHLPRTIDGIKRKLKIKGDEDAKAAVAILFRSGAGGLELLLVKRSFIPSDPWSGDMAFPGGKVGPLDRGLMETVYREVFEETGIDLRTSGFLGAMDPFYSSVRPEMGVLPLVFLVEGTPEIRLNEELSSFLWVPMGELRVSKGRSLVKKFEVPAFHVKGEVVWGLTYRMIEKLLELVEGC